MVTTAFPSRSRLTLEELGQALVLIEDAGVLSHSLTHASLEVFSTSVGFDLPCDVAHLDKGCQVLASTQESNADAGIQSRFVRVELLTSDVVRLCAQCASEPLGRRLQRTTTLLLLASSVASLTTKLELWDTTEAHAEGSLCDVLASLYSASSTLKRDIALVVEQPLSIQDLDDVLSRAASAVLASRADLTLELARRADREGHEASGVVLGYFEHDYVSPWKQDPVEALIRFAYDDPEFINQVFSRASTSALGSARGLIVLPGSIAGLWRHGGQHLVVVASDAEVRLRQLMPLTWALMNQGGSLSDPVLAFQAATVLFDEADLV
jgi:hypothetical protein